MTYSPLTTGSETISTGTYYGVFNENFEFRKAIEGNLNLNTNDYPTDQFLTDYFQFVGYTKINGTLLDKIGWRNIAYSTAANDFARSLDGVALFLDKYQTVNGNTYSNDIDTALNAGTWINYCSDEIVDELISKLFTEDLTLSDFENIINYVFSSSCEESVYITQELRQSIIEYLVNNNPDAILSSNLLTFDNVNSYSSVLAEVLSTNSDNEVKNQIKLALDTYISNVDDASRKDLLVDYLNYLGTNGSTFFSNNSEQARYDLAVSFFENIDDSAFYSALYYSLSDSSRAIIDNIESANLKLYSSYNSFTAQEKLDFYLNILSDNTNNMSTYLDTMSDDINLYTELNQKGYAISNFDSYLDSATITSSASDISTITERVNLYNQIRTTETFKNYMNSKNISTIGSDNTYSYVAKATELRNTFRSDYAPISDSNDESKPGWSGDLAYTYATNVTPQTYFYGPYMNKSKDTVFSTQMPTAAPTTDGTSGTTNNKYSVFVSDDQDFMDRQVQEGNIYDYTAYYYEYGSGASNNQFTSRLILGPYNNNQPYFRGDSTDTNKGVGKRYDYYMTDFTGVQVTSLEDVWVTDDDGVEFNARGGVISPYFRQANTDISGYDINTSTYSTYNYYGYFYITDANGVVHYFSLITESGRAHSSNHGNLFTNNGTNCTYHGWADFIWNYGKTVYHAYATEKLHPTRITGFWRHKDGNWWWTNKVADNRARTSSYIDYSIDDLLALDGVLSLYDGVTQSSDEREIINNLFNTYFIGDNNFESVVKACFLEKLAYTMEENIDIDYINSFVSANINTSKTINSSAPLSYLAYDGTTVYNYLLSMYSGDSKSKLLQAFSSNTAVFKEIVEIILNAKNSTMTDAEREEYLSYALTIEDIMNGTITLDSSGRIVVDNLVDETAQSIFDSTISSSSNMELNYYDSLGQYGITFDSITFDTNVNATSDVLKLVYNASGATNTELIIKDDNGDVIQTQAITTSPVEYELDLTTLLPSSITLESNQNVILYSVDLVTTGVSSETNTVSLDTQTVNSSSVALRSVDTLTASVEALGYSNVEITNVTISFNVKNTDNNNPRYVAITATNNSNTTKYAITDSQIEGGGLATLVYDSALDILQTNATTTVYCRRGSSTTSLGSSSTINSIVYSIAFTYDQTYDATMSILPGEILYDDAYDRIHKYDAVKENAVDGYIQYTTSNGISSDYVDAYLVEHNTSETYYDEFIESILIYLMPLDGNTDLITSIQNEMLADEALLAALASFSNDNIKQVINSVDNIDTLKIILSDYLVESSNYLLGSIIDNLNDNNKINDTNKKYILAAYLATDYSRIYEETLVNSDTKITSTVFYNKLNVLASNYQYIKSDGTFDNDKFDNFVLFIGYDMTTSGYGIYALASSKGILNGQFIPDNFALDSMDAKYDFNSTDGYWYLTEEATATWRGGIDSNGSSIRAEGSVNYAFLTDMKQLKLSISTTIFELNLVDEDGKVLYSSEELIDFENGTIIYYVPSNYSGYRYQWYSQSIANGAILDKTNISGSNYISVGNDTTILVTAEDPTIALEYTITIISVDVSFELSDANPASLPASGGNVIVELTSDGNSKLPYGLDITPYISLKKNGEVFNDYSFADDAIIDENGDATINLIIDSSLPWGTYDIEVALFSDPNLTKSSSFSKIKSTEAEIIDFEYDGAPQSSMISENSLTTEIKFGRLFTYEELTDYESSNFYLSYLSYSDNADLSITADYTVTNGLITYTVIYDITAEDTNYSSRYIHTLVEQDPVDIANYATIYKDGRLDSTATIDSSKNVNISFERGTSPYYRIKYNLNRVYTDGANVEYSYSTSNASTSVDSSYTGLSVNIPDALEAGLYTFNYIYQNSAMWVDDVYEKNYSFPTVYVLKDYSKDALLKKITFLENSAALTASTTVMNAPYAIKSEEETGSANEPIYYDLRDLTSNYREINVTSKYINYANTGTDYSTETNFFTVGSVSNATLSDYAPVFAIEDHAQMYQYTTQAKLNYYGYGVQTEDDTTALTTNADDILYLYVPFVNPNDETVIFMIKCDDGLWSDVFTDSYESTGLIYSYEEQGFTYNNVKYTLSDKAGAIKDNSSLYMDYIGTPLDNHFWYVSYVIFSEDYLENSGTHNDNLKFYHVAIIDATNTIYLDLTFDASNATNFNMDSFYLNITDRIYPKENEQGDITTSYASAFVIYDSESMTYSLETQLQVLPHGYFYFTLDLPEGYVCEYKITSTNKNNQNVSEEESGAYLPPSSIITQRISITIYIKDGDVGQTWGESTSDVYGQVATEIKTN